MKKKKSREIWIRGSSITPNGRLKEQVCTLPITTTRGQYERNLVQTRQPNNPPDVAKIIAQQLQNSIPNIVTQVTNNLNNGNGNGNGGGNNGCTYKGFVACGPRDFDGTSGAVALTRWIKKMESVIDNSGCLDNQRVKYVASSFIGKALTWWNTQVQARGRDAANAMAWNDFKALLTTEFCPNNEIEKLEGEFWNHSMAKRVTRYINGLPSQIRRMLRATQPATIQAAIFTAGILLGIKLGALSTAKSKVSTAHKLQLPVLTS
ncbi:putative reverse transcriptase domain-containing protein [Tanacetum coccineum]